MTEPVDTFSVEAMGVTPGANPAHVTAELALAFGIPEPSARAILDRAPVRVKANVDPTIAKQLTGKLLRAGMDVRITNDRTGADRIYRASEVAAATPPGERLVTPLLVVDRPPGADALAKVLSQGRTSSANRAGSDGRLGSTGGAPMTDLAAAAAMAVATPPSLHTADDALPPDPPVDGEYASLADDLIGATSAQPPAGAGSFPSAGPVPPGTAEASGAFPAQDGARAGVSRDACFACKRTDRDRAGQCRSCGYSNRDRKRHCRKCSKAELRLTTAHATHPRQFGIALAIALVASIPAWIFIDDARGMVLSGSLAALTFWLSTTSVWACRACGEPAVGFPLQEAEESSRKMLQRVLQGVAAVLLVVTIAQPLPLLFRPTLSLKGKVTYTAAAGRLAREMTTRQARVYLTKSNILKVEVAEAHDHDGDIELFLLATSPYSQPAEAKGIPDTFVTHLLEGLLSGSLAGAVTSVSAAPDHLIVEAPFEGSAGGADAHTIYGTVRVHQYKGEFVVQAAGGRSRSAQRSGAVTSFLEALKPR